MLVGTPPKYSSYFSDSYLSRCQVATPESLVKWVWARILERRPRGLGAVLDLGAGDGRFASCGKYRTYTGVEIDARKISVGAQNAKVLHGCALAFPGKNYSACLGNPPFVRHHDLANAWRDLVIADLKKQTGITIDRRANAYLFFLLKALLVTHARGLVAQIVPFEWLARPSAQWLRDYVRERKWAIYAYRLPNDIFDRVLTTSSLTIIDKRERNGQWCYYRVANDLEVSPTCHPSGSRKKVIAYTKRNPTLYAQRGLSPGTQKVFCLTETERQRLGLKIGTDVCPCIKSLRPLGYEYLVLDKQTFEKFYVDAGERCWLIRSDERHLSRELKSYLNAVPEERRDTQTCTSRTPWYRYRMPRVPEALFSLGFVKKGPKFLDNQIKAQPVGAVAGIHLTTDIPVALILSHMRSMLLTPRLVAHSKTLKKIEVNQLNSLLQEFLESYQ